jgi:ABC-type transport system substrate-binding protein
MKKVTRRDFLRLSGVAAAGIAVVACAKTAEPTTPPEAKATAAAPTATTAAAPTATPQPAGPSGKQSPMLQDLVAAGSLPEVEDRLPDEILVVKPTNAIGKYGGTLRGAGMAPETTSDLQILTDTGLNHFSNDLTELYPNLNTSFEFTDNNQTCVVHLRKGVKWSDGEPFTADDMMFYFEDWQFNPDLSPQLSSRWRPGGEPMTVTKVDDFTVRFTFAIPHPAFYMIHHSGGPIIAWRPKHFMEQFHVGYNPQADEQAKAAGFDNWQARFGRVASMNYGIQQPELPVVQPWKPVSVDSERMNYERNPYYMATSALPAWTCSWSTTPCSGMVWRRATIALSPCIASVLPTLPWPLTRITRTR